MSALRQRTHACFWFATLWCPQVHCAPACVAAYFCGHEPFCWPRLVLQATSRAFCAYPSGIKMSGLLLKYGCFKWLNFYRVRQGRERRPASTALPTSCWGQATRTRCWSSTLLTTGTCVVGRDGLPHNAPAHASGAFAVNGRLHQAPHSSDKADD